MGQSETGWDRLRKVALWQWGLLCIISGFLSIMVTPLIMPQQTGAAAQGAAAGRLAVMVLAIIVGVVLIVMHFVKRK